MPTISFDNVSLSYGEREVLHPFSLTLTEHRIGIIGANGGGKSSLIRLINGLGEPTTGTITVDGPLRHRHHRWQLAQVAMTARQSTFGFPR